MAARLHGRTILVVEDEPLTALDLAHVFRDMGAHVVASRSLQDALAVVPKHQWSAAVLDYALCDGNCSSLCEWMSAHDVPFVVCTVHENISQSCRKGVHMLKPIDMDQLVETVALLATIGR
jgi:DNA-binding NtrC family response regulator